MSIKSHAYRFGVAGLLWIWLSGLCTATHASTLQAGLARIKITPPVPFWLTGYASRNKPAQDVVHDLWAKAMALEDDHGERAVVVTTDLIGLPRVITEAAARRLQKRHGLARTAVLFNSSHTHCGPFIQANLTVMLELNDEDQKAVDAYSRRLTDQLVEVASRALAVMQPARLDFGHGQVGFAVNRREPTEHGFRIGVNPNGPVDHDVPVLRITTPEGKLRAVLFGYACHNTTLGGDFYSINGDYAGFAQLELERRHPGAMALFMMLCGGDQNPHPRGTLALAEQHGRALADAVDEVLHSPELRPVNGSIRTAFRDGRLRFVPHTREQFEAELKENHVFRQRRARLMLQAYDAGKPVRSIRYPAQAIAVGDDVTLVGLGGEVVVDYALQIKKRWPRKQFIVAGYCNDVMCYIPTRRILKEGGYEPDSSMIYYGQPGPFHRSVESRVMKLVEAVLADLQGKAGPER